MNLDRSGLVALGHPVLRDISASLHTKPLLQPLAQAKSYAMPVPGLRNAVTFFGASKTPDIVGS